MFIQNDNLKIMKCLKKLFSIYDRSLYMKKILNFQKFRYNIILLKQYQSQQFGLNINKQNIHNKLFDGVKKRENHLNELARKINEDEEKNCSFTPQINNKIIFNPFQNYTNNLSNSSKKINSLSYCKNVNNKKKINYKYNPNINNSTSTEQKTNSFSNPYETIDNNNLNNNKYYYLYSFDIPKYVLLQAKKTNKSFSKNNKFRKKNPIITLNNHLISNKEQINNHIKKPLYPTSIPENLYLLFSSRLNIDNKKVNNKKIKPKKIKKSIFDNSSLSNYNEKGTNYITESRTEHLSSINHELNYSKKLDNKKKLLNQSDNPLRNGINPYSYSASRKSTHYISPKSTERNNLITNKTNNNNNYYGTFSNYVEYSRDDNKINPNLRKKKNNDISNNKSNNINSISNLSNFNTTNSNSNNNNKIYSNNRTYNKNLEVERNVVNEKIIYNKDDERLSRRSSNSHMTIQTISDSKLFDLANIYVRTDESLERFRLLNKYNQKRRISNKNN